MSCPTLAEIGAPFLGGAQAADLEIRPIAKGGSTRRFSRLLAPGGPSLIAMEYDGGVAENLHYCEVAEFLRGLDVPAPQILLHDPNRRLVLMQDLGESDLWSRRHEPWEIRRPLYQSALRAAHRLHGATPAERARQPRFSHGPFDEKLYRWEQSYFCEHGLGRILGLPETRWREIESLPALHAMARALAARPRVLVHRDFQSQNILVRDGQAWLIDFQGMREGLAAYDLASLLFDPYVELAETERAELLDFYRGLGPETGALADTLAPCAAQRLMQALGAYGFLGHVKGRADFLAHAPNALRSLRRVLEGLESLAPLRDILGDRP